MLYVTPRRYRALGTGIDISAKTDAQLRLTLESASQAANDACHAPDGYSFLGGSVSAEEHQWPHNSSYGIRTVSGRIWPLMRPVIDASLVRINVTRNQHVDFVSAALFVQTDLGYVEPVGTPNTTALMTAVPPFLMSSPVAYVDYDYGFHFNATDELLAVVSGGSLIGGHQFWFSDEDVELKKNGTTVPSGDYTIDYYEGEITPTVPATDDDTWTASYAYKCPPGVANATAIIATDQIAYQNIAASGMLGLSGIKVEEVELRQSSKVNYGVTPVSPAAQMALGRYAAMFTSMR